MVWVLLAFACLSDIMCVKGDNLKICFHTNELNERGITVAIYAYAHYNEKIQKNKSLFALPNVAQVTQGLIRSKFERRFNGSMHLYDKNTRFGMITMAQEMGCDVVYVIKAGGIGAMPALRNQMSCKGPPVAVHAVFYWQKHGASYAMITEAQAEARSKQAAAKGNADIAPAEFIQDSWVPHIIEPPKAEGWILSRGISEPNMGSARKLWWRVDTGARTRSMWALCTIPCQMSKQYRDRNSWSCVKNMPRNAPFIPSTSDQLTKEAYFHKCDVMLHARKEGKHFSLALGEASVPNIPLLFRCNPPTPEQPIQKQGKALKYENKEQLVAQIGKLMSRAPKGDDNAYEDFLPEAVMARFNRILIQRALDSRRHSTGNKRECMA
jgi:hypothetical protein